MSSCVFVGVCVRSGATLPGLCAQSVQSLGQLAGLQGPGDHLAEVVQVIQVIPPQDADTAYFVLCL